MPTPESGLRPTIDRAWLDAAAAREPLLHAYAVWDLERMPASIRFVSAIADGRTVGYLLLFLGGQGRSIVHWYGDVARCAALAGALPPAPCVAVVPAEAEPLVADRYPNLRRSVLRLLLRPRDAPLPAGAAPRARRLGAGDRASLEALCARHDAPELAGYPSLDLAEEPVFGAFDGGTLVGVARASVRLPRVWVVNGVFVEPTARRRGCGEAVVAAVVGEAGRAGAPAGLYVREEAEAARRLYARLGFQELARRTWLEAAGPGAS
ncbi:MAG TPA: GNAT family N-acetyltransferase [Thermoplasmata archaeon]|nr:GNAT family N-acetyltransferase [Thermoplasmata archaeon]